MTPQQALEAQRGRYASREERLFRALDREAAGRVDVADLWLKLEQAGLPPDDFRLAGLRDAIGRRRRLDRDAFEDAVRPAILLVEQALQGEMVLPDFHAFCDEIDRIHDTVLPLREGDVARYIPQLARVDPEQFGVALCTIDGQRYARGDARTDFCVQSTCKPVNYCLALEEHGVDGVHRYIGREPSGSGFNALELDKDNKPHNPMINAGAIMACSLVRPGLSSADRFDHVLSRWKALAGGRRPRFSNSVYLSERATADRNFALGYFMREKGAFPEGTPLVETLEFYFQCCAIEVNAEDMAVIAATLANGGVCPVSGERVLAPETVQHCLSLMYSCGMYDFSGEFAFTVGLPAKSGVAGALMIVVPNVMGLCTWSPRLDALGNSVRGVAFCRELVTRFNFHNYDNLTGLTTKTDPRIDGIARRASRVHEVILAASKGDLGALQRQSVRGVDLTVADYDLRTPLHLAAAEGRVDVLRWFLSKGVDPNPQDRWGGTPLDDALAGEHLDAAAALREAGARSGSGDRPLAARDVSEPAGGDDRLVIQMIWAASLGDIDAVQRLVARGAELDGADYDLRGPLHLAAAEGHEPMVRFLLAHGVDPSPRDRWGGTPADDATRHGHGDLAELLRGASTPAT